MGKKILLLAPYPASGPTHGGRLRARAMTRAYQQAGHTVHYVGLGAGDPDAAESWEQNVNLAFGNILASSGGLQSSSLDMWRSLAESADSFRAYAAIAEAFRPDVIQFEEPYLWFVADRLRRMLSFPVLVHSSYNLEYEMTGDLAAADAKWVGLAVADLKRLERDVARGVDLVITVSEHDRAGFQALGAESVVVAPNGSAIEEPRAAALKAVDNLLPDPFALFVSSAHPPSIVGFLDLIEGSKASLDAASRIVICGSICDALRQVSGRKLASRVLSGATLLGPVSDGMLSGLYARAGLVLLPKLRGGGSSLKTADAIRVGRRIVATPLAFRGFEAFEGSIRYLVTADPEEFWRGVTVRLGASDLETEAFDDRLSWQSSLKPAVDALKRYSF